MTSSLAAILRRTASAAIIAAALAGAPALAQPVGPASASASAVQSPRKSVAVIDFSSNGAFQAQYGGSTVGGGLAAMLETELSQTGRFLVANRSHVDAAFYEQQLGTLGLNAARTAKPGALVGAQFLVRGSVTEFAMADKGGGFSLSGPLGGALAGLSPQVRSGRVAIDFQVIDSTSGEVVDSFTVSRKLKSTSLAITAVKNGVSGGANTFSNTPLGEAARSAIAEAAQRIAGSLADRQWTARVAQVAAGSIYVNAGADGGLRPGMTLQISREAVRITDPVTGALLGVERVAVGSAVIRSVNDKYATAAVTAGVAAKAGDVLTLVGG